MKKIFTYAVGAMSLLAGVANAYLLFFRNEVAETVDNTETVTPTQSSNEGSLDTQSKSSEQAYQDGTYTGALTSTNRGDYQLQVTIENGQMTDITVLEYPNENDMSLSINNDALPTYTVEALSNQSAQVNQISGATEAYKGFTGSLQDALNQAL